MKFKALHLLLLFSLGIFIAGCDNEDEDLTPPGNGSGTTEQNDDEDDDDNETTVCPDQPVFNDSNHEMLFSMIGSSCVNVSEYGQYTGHAQIMESPAHPDCTVDGVHYFKIHLGHADPDELSNSFDVDIYLLTDVAPEAGTTINLENEDVNAYFTTIVDGSLIGYKTSTGTFTLQETNIDEVDMEATFSMTATSFVLDSNPESGVIGEGSTPANAETIEVSGNCFIVDQGLSCGE